MVWIVEKVEFVNDKKAAEVMLHFTVFVDRKSEKGCDMQAGDISI